MGYITSPTVPSGTKYFVLAVPDDLYMRIAVRGALGELCNEYSWEMAGTEGLTEEAQAALFCAAYENMQELAALPTGGNMFIGEIKWFGTYALPDGVLPCDGAIRSRADYPDLYSVLPPALVLDTETFRTPALADRFIQATEIEAEIGTSVGSNDVTLSIENIPEHTHYFLDFTNSAFVLSTAAGGFRYSTGTARDLLERQGTGGIVRAPQIETASFDNRPAAVRLRAGIVAYVP